MSTASEEHYPLDSILFLEEMWGDGFLSPGGPEEVERLLAGVDLAGRTVVDIGSGAGGVPLLLANRHGAARVIGLDVEASVVAHARAKVDLPVFYGACPSGEHAPVARRQGRPYDPERLALFQVLHAALRDHPPLSRMAPDRGVEGNATLAFFEAYFSNFIEGTEFAVDEAAGIVFRGVVPNERPADAHDILGTWRIVSDNREMGRIPTDADTLEALLKARHALIMEGRPDRRPAAFKQAANQAGPTVFVAPDLVTGTLVQGFDLYRSQETPFQRAVFMMFLIAEVHPFADGNGRTARIMMNAELVAVGEERIIVPTVYRANYLSALKALSQAGRPEPIIRMLDYVQRWTAAVDWRSLEETRRELEDCNAFVNPNVAEVEGRRLRMPGRAVV